MLSPLETTALLLAYCVVLSALWAQASYTRLTRSRRLSKSPPAMIIPALILAPITLLLSFKVLGLNLLFPVELASESRPVAVSAFAPAVVLFFASGLAGTLSRQIRLQYLHWQAQPFAVAAAAFGQKPSKTLHRLVLCQAFGTAWAQCLPWLYGELLVVEAVFNAPGLGLHAWHLARIHDHAGLAQTMACLASLYLLAVGATAWGNRRLGKLLESYA